MDYVKINICVFSVGYYDFYYYNIDGVYKFYYGYIVLSFYSVCVKLFGYERWGVFGLPNKKV